MSVTIFSMLSVTVDLPIEKLYKLQEKNPTKKLCTSQKHTKWNKWISFRKKSKQPTKLQNLWGASVEQYNLKGCFIIVFSMVNSEIPVKIKGSLFKALSNFHQLEKQIKITVLCFELEGLDFHRDANT